MRADDASPADLVALAAAFERVAAAASQLEREHAALRARVETLTREFAATLERAAGLAWNGSERGRAVGEADTPRVAFDVGTTVREMERRLICETLRRTRNNRTHAAKLLGISIRTLRNKLHEYRQRGDLEAGARDGKLTGPGPDDAIRDRPHDGTELATRMEKLAEPATT